MSFCDHYFINLLVTRKVGVIVMIATLQRKKEQ